MFLNKLAFLKKLTYPTLGILFVGLVLSLVTRNNVWKQEKGEWLQKLEQEAKENTLILGGELEVIDRELMGIVSLFGTFETVTRSEFKTFVTPLLQRHGFIQAFQWVPRTPLNQRLVLESMAQRDGFPGFRFREQDEAKSMRPAEPRSEYFPIYYIEPYTGNEALLGFDAGSQPELLSYIMKARDSGTTTASVTRRWFEGDQRKGILIFAPYYEGSGVPETAEERRRLFRGAVVGAYRVDDMMEEMIHPYMAQGLSLTIFDKDATDPSNRIHGKLRDDAIGKQQTPLSISGRPWHLIWQGTRDFKNGPSRAYVFWLSFGVFVCFVFIATIFEIATVRTRLKLEVKARQLTEKELHTAKNEAEAANQAKSSFLANMSHEIRTPMNAILGYAQILQRNQTLDKTQKKNIECILHSGDHLLRIINDILDLSKIEAGKMELQPLDFDLNQTVRTVAAIIEPQCEEKNLQWRLDGLDEPSLPVHGDEFKLKQILINLLSNAVKFTESGSISLKWATEESNHYLFEVIDTGQGIPANMRSRIFEPFEQAGNNKKQEGTGLGLAITRKQIELMSGNLVLKSAVGEGSRFVFTVHLPPAIGEIAPRALLGSNVSHLAKGQQVKALVADDDTTNRNVLSEILESVGVETFVAENGRDAVDRVRAHRPDIVFMDMRMPIMNGIEAIKEINREFPDGQIKTVAVSASALNNERKDFISVGCNDFISKPVQMEQVLACMTRLLHVEFEYEESDPNQLTHGASAQVPQIHIPDNLYVRLREAARLHNISDLKDCLAETIALGENGRSLLKHLYPFVEKYDMDGIHHVLEQIKGDN